MKFSLQPKVVLSCINFNFCHFWFHMWI